MGFLGLFKSGKKAGDSSVEPEFLRKIDLSAAELDEAHTADNKTSSSADAFAMRGDVEPELALWLSNGLTARNLKELAAALKKMSVKDYKEYADSQRNEIAEWVQEMLNDKQLAGQLRKAKNKIRAAKLVEKASRMRKSAKPAKATAIKVAKVAQKAGKSVKVKAKEKIRSYGRGRIAMKKERGDEELGLPKLPELPPMPDILPMPKEVEKAPRIGRAWQEISTENPKPPKPRLSLWPFSKKKGLEGEHEQQMAAEPLIGASEMRLPLPEMPKLPAPQIHEHKAKAKPAKKIAMAEIPAQKKASKKQGAEDSAEAPQPIPTLQDEKMPWEEALPEFPEADDLPAEKFEVPQLTESPELPAIKDFKVEPGLLKKPETETEAVKPPLRIGFANAEKPKRFLFFGMKPKPKEEKPAEEAFNHETLPELGTGNAAQANEHEAMPKKRMFGTYLQRKEYNAGPIPEAALAEKAEEAFEPEPQHAMWEDLSVMEESPAPEEEKEEKLQPQATKAERINKAVITRVEEENQWKPDVQEHSQLDRQSKELERTEQILNREEEELNTRRLELTRRRYEIIKQKGELEKRRFEEFMDRHKLAPQNKEIMRKTSQEHVMARFSEPERPAAQLKGMPDFRLAGAYGKERLEELLEQAKQNISGNNIQAAKRALDEVQSVFNTVYMTTSEKKHIEYEILDLEADLKLATLD